MVPTEHVLKLLAPQRVLGTPPSQLTEVVKLDAPPRRATQLCWCSDKNLSALSALAAGTVICSKAALELPINSELSYLIVENPRFSFLQVVREFFYTAPAPRIEKTALIDPTAQLGNDVSIGHYAVIEQGCQIGDGSSIGAHTVLHRDTIVGKRVAIGCHNTIGGIGFGYEKNASGQYELIPHLGNVVIEDLVEIGNNTCIDRAPLGSTRIGRNAKIDNLVHVAHGCDIGENALLIANSMIGGSTQIGPGAWIAPSAVIKNGIAIGADALVGLGAVVLKSVEPGLVVAGNPARTLKSDKP